MDPIKLVNPENLYQTVAEIEAVKHPVMTPQNLDAAGDYLAQKMQASGLAVREQPFSIDGWAASFRNIEGQVGPLGQRPAAVLVSHYDTVATTPGANDNGAGCAVILEVGRVLAQIDNPPPVHIVTVCLEENNNPTLWQPEYESLLRHGIQDEQLRYTSWAMAKAHKAIWASAYAAYATGKSYGSGLRKGLKELGKAVPAALLKHFEEIITPYDSLDPFTSMGVMNRIGSSRWVEEAMAMGRPLAFNITVDEPGIYYDEPYTQRDLAGIGFEQFAAGHGLDADRRVGNFILAASNQPSMHLGQVFGEHCANPDINMPFGWVHAPLTYEQIAAQMPIGLNSDHAPFWRAGIPGMLVFDSSNARDPFIHTMADTVDKINFDKLAKVTQAIVASLLDQRLWQ